MRPNLKNEFSGHFGRGQKRPWCHHQTELAEALYHRKVPCCHHQRMKLPCCIHPFAILVSVGGPRLLLHALSLIDPKVQPHAGLRTSIAALILPKSRGIVPSSHLARCPGHWTLLTCPAALATGPSSPALLPWPLDPGHLPCCPGHWALLTCPAALATEPSSPAP